MSDTTVEYQVQVRVRTGRKVTDWRSADDWRYEECELEAALTS